MKAYSKDIKIDLFAVAPGVWGMKDIFVNMFVILNPSHNNWVLVDAGLKWSAPKIRVMVDQLFGTNSRPSAIVLTHGHFDHVGSLAKLAEEWDIPVYAHHLEIPYLTGISSYPPPDPSVGGGLMAELSFLYPKGPINIEDRVISLPEGGRIPGLPEWQYIHTPGHAPGHISLYRETDKVLIAGDAFVTTKQESAIAVMFQTKKLSGPPKYFTPDWLSAAWSVEQLAKLEPEVVATGHGRPMRGASMRKSLHNLARDFEKVAVPGQGRYVHQPALMDDTGVVSVPPRNKNAHAPMLKLLGISAAILLTMLLFKSKKKKVERALSKVKENIPEKTAALKAKAQSALKEKAQAASRVQSDLKDKARSVVKDKAKAASDAISRSGIKDKAQAALKAQSDMKDEARSAIKDKAASASKALSQSASKVKAKTKTFSDESYLND